MTTEVAIKMTADGRAVVVEAKKAEQALQGVGTQAGKTGAALQGASRASEGLEAGMRGVEQSARAGGAGLRLLGQALGGLSLMAAVAQFVQAADAVTTLNNQLKLATGSTRAAGQAYEALFDIAQRSRVSFTELGGTFAAISRAGQELGLSQQRLLGVTEAIGNAMTISGGSAASMSAALVQLSQGLASGMLRGEELNSVMEQTPRLARALADGLGVSIGKLREMGAAGEITSEQVIRALESQSAVLSGEVQGAVLTVGQAMTQLQNATIKTVGDMDAATGASATLASTLSGLASAVGGVGEAFKAHETTIRVGMGVLAGAGTAAGALAVSRALGVAGVAGSIGVVRTAFLALSAAMATNPVGLALLGLGAVVGGTMMLGSGKASPAEQLRTLERDAQRLAAAEARLAANGGAGQGQYSARLEAHIEGLRASVQAQVQALGELGNADAKLASLAARRQQATQSDTAASTEAAQALAALTGQKKDYIATLNKYQGWLKTGAITEQQYIALTSELAKNNYKAAQSVGARATTSAALTEAERALREEQQRSAEVVALRNKLVGEAFEAQQKLQEADRNASAEAAEAAQKAALSLQDQVEAQRQQNATIGLTREAVVALEAAKLREQATSKDRLATMADEIDWSGALGDSYRAQAAALRELAALKESGKAKNTAVEQAREADTAWKAFYTDLERGLTDSLFRAFESGKGFFKTLWDGIRNLFKTTVLKLAVQAVVGGAGGLLGGPAAAGQGGASVLGSLDRLSGTLGNLMTNGGNFLSGATLNAQAAGMWTRGGDWLAASSNNTMAGMGEWMQANPGMGSAMGMAGNAFAAYGISKSLSGGYSTGLPVNEIAAIASMIPGVGPLAGVVGGLVNRAFGRKLKDSGIQGEFGGAQGFEGEQFQFLKGGWFRSDKTKTSALAPEMQQALAGQYTAMKTASAGLATTLGLSATALDTYTRSIKISTKGLTEEQTAQKLAEEFSAMGDEMASLLLGTAEYTRTGETASATLARLSGSLTALNTQFEFMGSTLFTVGLYGADAASALADAMGGLEAAGAKISAYYANFYSGSEQTANITRALTTTLGALGLALPETREGFRALVEAQDLTTERGRTAYATLMQVQDAFTTLTPSAADLAEQLGTVTDAISRMFDELRGQIGTVRAAVASGREAITGGPPVRTYAQIMASIARTSTAAPSRAALDAAAQRLRDTQTATAVYQRQADSANTAASTATGAFNGTKSAIVTAEAAENAAFAKLGYAYGGGFTVDGNGKPVWSSGEMNGQSRWAKSLGGGWNASLGAYEGPAALAAMRGGTAGEWNSYWSSMGTTTPPAQDPNAPWNRLDALSKQYNIDKAALDTAVAAQTRANSALTSATTAMSQAQTAMDTAEEQYATAVTAWVAASTLSAEALGKLKDETLAYYEQQKALAETMRASATGLRTAVAAAQLQTLTSAQSLTSRLGQFAQDYSLARATSGAVKAGYADKMAEALPQLSADLAASSASRVDWAVAVARLTSQSQAIADQLDATAPATYETESLTLLDAIDGKLASMNTTADSLQVSITAAVNNGATRTAAGLSNLIRAVQGDKSASLQTFATGGVFTGGVVNSPTLFNMGLMGEAGPEAIMPLTRGPGGALGVQVYGAGAGQGGDNTAAQRELLAEIKRLGERLDGLNREVQQMRQENNIGNAKIADSTDRSARLQERWNTIGLPATEAARA